MKKTSIFNEKWRREKSSAFKLEKNSSARKCIELNMWGESRKVYANANLSIYSAQKCNAKCPFCVEELRPASRGTALENQKTIEKNDTKYFQNLEEVLLVTKPLDPSVSITGGEASKDPRLPKILQITAQAGSRKRTMTTNASGLLDIQSGKRNIDWIVESGLSHLNISRAHYENERNAHIMRYREGLEIPQLKKVVTIANKSQVRVRLSCVLLNGEVDTLGKIINYLKFAESIGVDNVIFRQLMKTDPRTTASNYVVSYSDLKRTKLEYLLDEISVSTRFNFQRQIIGYYYYVEVWKFNEIDVVFEEADLAQLENTKRQSDSTIHELIFHPNAQLCSSWQPWDGQLGPQTPKTQNILLPEELKYLNNKIYQGSV